MGENDQAKEGPVDKLKVVTTLEAMIDRVGDPDILLPTQIATQRVALRRACAMIKGNRGEDEEARRQYKQAAMTAVIGKRAFDRLESPEQLAAFVGSIADAMLKEDVKHRRDHGKTEE